MRGPGAPRCRRGRRGPKGLGLSSARASALGAPGSARVRLAGPPAGRCAPGARPPRPAGKTPGTYGGDCGGDLLRGRGWEDGLQDFPLVKRDWQPSHPYRDPPARMTARKEPRFLRDPNGAPQSLSYPVLLNFPACSSTLDHPLKRKGLWPPLSPWPSGCRQVVLERPRLTYSMYPSFPRDFSKLHHCLAFRQVLGCHVAVSYTGF